MIATTKDAIMPYDSVPPPPPPGAPEPAALSAGRGFLPAEDPLRRLPAAFDAWEEVAAELPKLLVAGQTRACVERMPMLDATPLADGPELNRAMLLLSFLGHAYVWEGPGAAPRLPAPIAVPWHAVAKRLGRPPVLSYASYALDNWRRLDPRGPIALGNIALLQNFLGGADEEWFITVHVDIEVKAAPALEAVMPAQRAAAAGAWRELQAQLAILERALAGMHATLARMPQWCDPGVYYLRVRPYIHGWKNHPALPEGLIYEGVAEYAGTAQRFRGETGAQSSIVPVLDALLGIAHHPDPLREYLMEMREYMPPAHRAFMQTVERGPALRDLVLQHGAQAPGLRELYDRCVEWIRRFRELHLQFAASYIHKQAQSSAENPTDVGTGGTPFMRYLKKHEDETAQALTKPHVGPEK
jgi:indoleamine 2,3-dioxygenase